jgi:BASS family bile acid:Na+ symporter
MEGSDIDQIRLTFSRDSLLALNVTIGLMMFGMALELRLADFKRVIRSPRGPAIGLVAQFVLLPAATFGLTFVLPVVPSIALGMILVAACPGGNLSNVMTWLAGGNTALSVSMTAVSTAAAVVMTPLNLALWGGLQPATAPILRAVRLGPLDVLTTIVVILGIPLALGITVARLWPAFVERARKPFKVFSVLAFLVFVAVALGKNWSHFVAAIGMVFFAVLIHNASALGLGYGAARLLGLAARDRRAVTIEVGLQNSALGLILVFNFFDGLGGMAVITAWWGIWHILSGLALATWFSRFSLEPDRPGSS